MSTLALLGLGSNLGDRKARLDDALRDLDGRPGVDLRSVSRYHETAPVGGPGGQGAFLNAAAAVETLLRPEELLGVLQEIERDAGRVRSVRWGERTLDLDLLLYGDQALDTPALRVPHPRMALRRFVLAPLAEVAPEAVDPVTGRSIADLLANLDRRPSLIAFDSSVVGFGTSLCSAVVEALDGLIMMSRVDEAGVARQLREQEPGRWLVANLLFQGLAPTFVVVSRDGLRNPDGRLVRPSLVGVPILEIDVEDRLDAVTAEIVAACEATRAG